MQEASSVVQSSTQLGDIPLERKIAVAAAPEGGAVAGRKFEGQPQPPPEDPGCREVPVERYEARIAPHVCRASPHQKTLTTRHARIWSSTAESSVLVTEHCAVSRDCRSGLRGDGYRVSWTSILRHRCFLKSPDAEQNHYTSVPCLPKMRRDSRALAADLSGIALGGPDWK